MKFNQYLIENALKQYIKNMQSLMAKQPENSGQRLYWEWIVKQAKPVKIVSYKKDTGLEELVSEFLMTDSPKVKECHRNSLMLSAQLKGIDVVSGWTTALGSIPIDHTWSFYKPKKLHFDLTGEICLGRKPGQELYMQIVMLKFKDAFKMMQSNQFSISGITGTYFQKKVLKK